LDKPYFLPENQGFSGARRPHEYGAVSFFATTTFPPATRLLTPALVPVPHPTERIVTLAGRKLEVDEAPHPSPPGFELVFDADSPSPDLTFFPSPASLPVM